MNQLIRVLRSEVLKMKHTPIIWFSIFVPVFSIFLYCLFTMSTKITIILQPSWEQFISKFFWFHTYGFILPVFIAYESSSIANLESSNNCWNRCFTLPVPRWMIYCTKFILIHCFTLVNLIVSVSCLIAGGIMLNHINPKLSFSNMIPWLQCFKCVFYFYIASLAVIAVQLLISIKFKERGMGFILGIGMSLLTVVFLHKYPVLNIFNPWMIDISMIQLGFIVSLFTRVVLGILFSAIIFWISNRHEFV